MQKFYKNHSKLENNMYNKQVGKHYYSFPSFIALSFFSFNEEVRKLLLASEFFL